MSNKKIIQVEFMKCDKCDVLTLHEIKLNFETKKVESIECYKCKYGSGYIMFETLHDSGVRYRLGI